MIERITFDKVQKAYDDALLLADRDLIRLIAASVIANQMDGNPVWLMVVASSSGGKTAILLTLDELEFIPGRRVTFFVSDLTENTLASGFKSAAGSDASLLNQMPIGGIMIFKDFTSMLTKRHEVRDTIMGQLREVYDRKFDKRTGNKQDVAWKGRVGALAGVTEAVHEFMASMSVMGDRFIMYSPKQPDRRELLRFMMGLKNEPENQEKRLLKARKIMHEYLSACVANLPKAKMMMNDNDKEHLMEVADFVTKARSGVIEDLRTGAVRFVPSAEMPTRLIDQLLSIGTALCLMGVVDGKSGVLDDNDMKLLYKIAFDSIPLKRLWALRELATYIQGVSTAGIASVIGYETNVVSQWLAQLNALGIINRLKNQGRGDIWTLKPEFRDIMVTYQNVQTKDGVLEDPNADDDELFSERALRESEFGM